MKFSLSLENIYIFTSNFVSHEKYQPSRTTLKSRKNRKKSFHFGTNAGMGVKSHLNEVLNGEIFPTMFDVVTVVAIN